MTLADYVTTDVDIVEGRQQTGTRSVNLWIGSDGRLIPSGEWREANAGDCPDGESVRQARKLLNVKVFRYSNVHDVAVQVIDVESRFIENQRMGQGGSGQVGLADAIDKAWNKLRVPIGAPGDPCEESEDEPDQAERSFELTPEPPPSPVVDVACTPGRMEHATNRLLRTPMPTIEAGTFDPSESQRPGSGPLRIQGLVNDEGTACSHHVAVYTRGLTLPFAGARSGSAAKMLERIRRLERAARERASGGDAPVASPASAAEEELDVVFQLYSPNGRIWQSGVLLEPRFTEHRGLGDWTPNAAALFSLQLPGTSPGDLRAGETYDAVAVTGSLEDGLRDQPRVSPTALAFYTRWWGDFARVPWSHDEDREHCLQAKEAAESMEFLDHLSGVGSMDCSYAEDAFQGVIQVVTGRLEGTVTIDRIDRGYVHGRYVLEGTGELRETSYRFRRNRHGTITGDRRVASDRRSGPLRIEGSILAPNRRSHVVRMVGLQTVVVRR